MLHTPTRRHYQSYGDTRALSASRGAAGVVCCFDSGCNTSLGEGSGMQRHILRFAPFGLGRPAFAALPLTTTYFKKLTLFVFSIN